MKDHHEPRTTVQEHDTQHDTPGQDTLLALYLNDHLAGATAGLALCRHLAETERCAGPGDWQTLDQLAEDLVQDRCALLDIMSEFSVPVRHYKIGAGWLGEKLARLMPHGSPLGRTRLNTLVELETLRLGVEGKACLWRSLAALPGIDESLARRLRDLLERARTQGTDLEDLRTRAAQATFTPR